MKKITFTLLCLEGFVLSFNVAATAAVVPSIAAGFGWTVFSSGKVVWLYMIPYGIAALIYGPLIRKYNAKTIELIALAAFSTGNLLAYFSPNMATLLFARLVMGIFGASVIPLALIMIGQNARKDKRGQMVGLFFSSTFIASLLGLFVSGIMHWRFIYLIPSIAGYVLCFMIIKWMPDFVPAAGKIKINYTGALRNKKVLTFFGYVFMISLLYHGVQQWLGAYFAERYNYDQFTISMLILATSLSGIAGELIGGKLSDSFGRLFSINVGTVMMLIIVTLLINKMALPFLIVMMLIWGLGWTINHAGITTLLTELPSEYLNEAASMNSSVRFISGGLGTVFSGLTLEKSYYLGLLGISICFCGMLLSSLMLKK